MLGNVLLGIPRYVQMLLILCIGSTIVCVVLIIFPNLLHGEVNREKSLNQPSQASSLNFARIPLKKRDFTNEQIGNMTLLGRWLVSPEGTLPPPILDVRNDPYLILVWKHGMFLERRHIRRFTINKYSPWDNCTVRNCKLSYESKDLNKADAVVFHLHLTENIGELPRRLRANQRWIFLTDESPMHTFLHGNQELSDYNGLFNWSMSYRMDSDVPMPYGRTILRLTDSLSNPYYSLDTVMKLKTKLVAIMGSNCAPSNGRWNYVNALKSILGNDLDIYGKCLDGNVTACPGHFDRDCPFLNAYKFYLAFENSNCREYLTEKVFWHGYHKLTVPIIMGSPKRDCEQLLPPRSYLHINDFANPAALANYIKYLDRHDDKYFEYHEWRKYYKVINEHGYFGSASHHYCRICEALHYNSPAIKVYEDMELFWNKERDCNNAIITF